MRETILFGACIFDEPNLPTSGWASIAGEEATRVNGVNELPQDVVWVTNLNYRVYTRLNLNKTLHIFDEQYFRSSVKSLAQEVGTFRDGNGLAVFCARVFQNTYTEAASVVGKRLPVHPYRFYSGIADIIAPAAVRRVPSHPTGKRIQQATKECTQANQAMFGIRPPLGSSPYPFMIPRAAYFAWMMKQLFPSCEGWKEVKDSTVSATIGTQHGRALKGTKAVLDKYCGLAASRALFLKVSVKSTDSFFQDFATFGAGSNYSRGYATLPEIMNLARFSKLEVGGGFSCETMSLDSLGLDYKANLFSFSRGLALENIFAALSNPLNGEKTGNFNGLSAYLRAYDRILCQRHAELMAKAGMTIGSYGTGRIMIYCKSHEIDHVYEHALSAGLMPPLALKEEL